MHDYSGLITNAHAHGVKVMMAADLLPLTLLTPVSELGADMVVGSAQRFGVPMGYGGPHAAFLATLQEYKRLMRFKFQCTHMRSLLLLNQFQGIDYCNVDALL